MNAQTSYDFVQEIRLNYHQYSVGEYEDQIVRSVPGHTELHQLIPTLLRTHFGDTPISILELGIGTGLTSEVILRNCSSKRFIGIDISDNMLSSARSKTALSEVELLLGDYAELNLPGENDLIVSVLGIHHQQTPKNKQALFRKIHDALIPGGVFYFGDLMTHRDSYKAALCEAQHYHHLVDNASDLTSLSDWAHHHLFLNKLETVEDQIEWLVDAGFARAEVVFEKFNTVLIIARRAVSSNSFL